MRLSTLIADVRALGIGAPARVVYEASKRTGFHRYLFRPGAPAPGPLKSYLMPPQVPTGVRARTLSVAGQILEGRIELFSRPVEAGDKPDWHGAIEGEGSWPVEPWWEIDIRSEERLGDVKWVWELGRHRHLVILARAAYLEPESAPYLEALETQLESWLEQNPKERGVHWYSNLELALRAVAWLQILSLVGDRLDPGLRRQMEDVLYQIGQHLMTDLPYTLSTMRNNHLIGDGLGLVAIGRAFEGDKRADRWARWGDRLIEIQLRRHFRADGSSIEDSVSYDRFVLEMLAVRMQLGDAPPIVLASLKSSVQYLCRLGVLEGSVPQIGDWDEGRVVATAGDAKDLRGSVHLALAVAGTGAPAEWRDLHDDVAWLVPDGEPIAHDAAETEGRDVGGAIGRAQRGRWTVWVKAGSGPSHGHADLLSVPVLADGEWVVGDPGTGTYNGPLEQRNYFRSSLAHNVARVRGIDQLEPHRAFRWKHSATGKLGRPVSTESSVLMWGTYDAYRRLDPPARVVRAVLVVTEGVVVADWIEGGQPAQVSLPLPPGLDFEGGRLVGDSVDVPLRTSGGLEAVRESTEPFDGWWSETYGQFEPATRLEFGGEGGPLVWSLGDVGFDIAADGSVEMGRSVLHVRFSEDVTLMVAAGGESREFTLNG